MPEGPQGQRRQVGVQVSFDVRPIDKAAVRIMVIDNHYSGRCPGIKYSFGLYEGGNCVGCAVYGMPASRTLCDGVCGVEYRQYVIELSRLVVITTTPNAASSLVGRSLAALSDHIVVSYADCNEHIGHVGYVYQATNWIYTGQGRPEPVWLHPKTGEVVSYVRRQVENVAAEFGLNKAQLVQRKQVGKHRYVYFTGTKRFKRDARAALRYETQPYPKGDTRRHDAPIMQVKSRIHQTNVVPYDPPPIRRLSGE